MNSTPEMGPPSPFFEPFIKTLDIASHVNAQDDLLSVSIPENMEPSIYTQMQVTKIQLFLETSLSAYIQ